ncbi:MAG TPA: TlpA disulfide reductase family protein [Dehalococcoidia bacterium]
MALAITTLVLVVIAIWWLNAGTPLPGRSRTSDATGQAVSDGAGGYVAFAVPANHSTLASVPAPKIGALAPDFTLPGLDGTPVRLSDLRGKTVLINFWATWCGPCRKEFPELVKLVQQQGDRGLVVLAVDVSESRDDVARFAQEFGATFPIVLDSDSSVVQSYRLIGLPTSLFVDRDGILRAQQLGPLSEASLTAKLGQAGLHLSIGR